MLTKKKTLILSSLFVGVFLSLIVVQESCSRDAQGFCWKYWAEIGMLGEHFIVSVPFFIMACIAYFLREETFRAWLKFAYAWVPLTMIAIFVAPEYGSPFLPITKGSIAGVSSLLFVLISIGIMVFKSVSTQARK